MKGLCKTCDIMSWWKEIETSSNLSLFANKQGDMWIVGWCMSISVFNFIKNYIWHTGFIIDLQILMWCMLCVVRGSIKLYTWNDNLCIWIIYSQCVFVGKGRRKSIFTQFTVLDYYVFHNICFNVRVKIKMFSYNKFVSGWIVTKFTFVR